MLSDHRRTLPQKHRKTRKQDLWERTTKTSKHKKLQNKIVLVIKLIQNIELSQYQLLTMTSNDALILVGGTGGLGMELAKGLVSTKGYGSYKAIVRDVTKAKALQDIGWTWVEVVDYFDSSALENAFIGAKTVISTFGGGDLVKLETATIDAAKKAGATLFVPSQFGTDYRRWDLHFPFLAVKQDVLKAAKDAGLPVLVVFTGCFTETSMPFMFDLDNNKATLVGSADSTAKASFTRRSDIGKVLAKALTDDTLLPTGDTDIAYLSISSEEMTFKEFIETYERVTGKTMAIEYIDPAAAKVKEQELLSKGFAGDFVAFLGSFVLHLLGEPERGSTGLNTTAEATSYGIKLETVEETLRSLYG
jgi:putative NADH-flavin reductase